MASSEAVENKRLLRELAALLRGTDAVEKTEDPMAELVRELEGLGGELDEEAVREWCTRPERGEAEGEQPEADSALVLLADAEEKPDVREGEADRERQPLPSLPDEVDDKRLPAALTDETLRTEVLLAKKMAVALKRGGRLDAARAELRRAKGLEAALLSGSSASS